MLQTLFTFSQFLPPTISAISFYFKPFSHLLHEWHPIMFSFMSDIIFIRIVRSHSIRKITSNYVYEEEFRYDSSTANLVVFLSLPSSDPIIKRLSLYNRKKESLFRRRNKFLRMYRFRRLCDGATTPEPII